MSEKMNVQNAKKVKRDFNPLMDVKISRNLVKQKRIKPKKEKKVVDQSKNYRAPQTNNRKERRAKENLKKEKEAAIMARVRLRELARKAKKEETNEEAIKRRKIEGEIMDAIKPTTSTKAIAHELKQRRINKSLSSENRILEKKREIEMIFEEMTSIKPLLPRFVEKRKETNEAFDKNDGVLMINEDYEEL